MTLPRKSDSGPQAFHVTMRNDQTGEAYEWTAVGATPELALRSALRRTHVAQALMSEQSYRFIVKDTL